MHRALLSGLASIVLLVGPATAADAPPGASSCTGCHAPKKVADSVIPHINGRKAEDIVTFMREYRSGAWPSSVMGRIAKGFDDQQTQAIAAWFAAQPE
ncbi:cytochrome C [Reyranella aquatilis]|jgi:cytochrome c553|uniref:Cytochrome C n=1 Tax=Reyranella aquatilis TaxID=2035356 RepID=A0ABS8KUL1_9HYPH|nr:cytochrome C [Reyranella aquatilis]MCC8429754.1 cytochrome C [Reyranella aquatilis]